MVKSITIERVGRTFKARFDNEPSAILVGRRVPYKGNYGLSNLSSHNDPYDPNKHSSDDFWYQFINPTVNCEGLGSFTTLNTYDRAKFTFGFMQFAAHVPNGDFVAWFRDVLKMPQKDEYFPDLGVENGRIVEYRSGSVRPLEDNSSTAALMSYLNPSLAEVEDREVMCAAKLIHWTKNDPAMVALQVTHAIELAERDMRSHAKRYGLDGKSDVICSVVFDIRHQGRGTSQEIMEALHSSEPLSALLEIGKDNGHRERCIKLGDFLEKQQQAGIFGGRVYDAAKEKFVPAPVV